MWTEELGSYTREYIAGYNRTIKESTVPDGEQILLPVATVVSYLACDGAVSFHFPPGTETETGLKPGGFIYDRESESLGAVVQAHSDNLIKISGEQPVLIRHGAPDWPPLAADLPREKIDRIWINPDTYAEASAEQKVVYKGVEVSPLRRYRGEKPPVTLPSRVRLFSPIIGVPKGRRVRQYSWLFADFFWSGAPGEAFPFSAQESLGHDLNVLRLKQEARAKQGPNEDPFATVHRHILSVCGQFEALVSEPRTREREVQVFLEQEGHQFLVAPVHTKIVPQQRLGGKFVLDFAVELPSGEWELVEIEDPNKSIFTQTGEEQSAHLTHAIGQVEDWLRYIGENRDTVRREDDLPGIHYPKGRVVAGRMRQLGEKAKRRLKFKSSENLRIEVQTYDSLLENARAYAETILRIVPGSFGGAV